MFNKEPQEVATFGIDWSDWLGVATIATSTWSAPAGITVDDDDFTAIDTSITLSGGTWGATYELSNTITAGAETETRSVLVRIQRSVAYCSALEVRQRIAKDTQSATTLPLAELEALIEQASRYFDLECGVVPEYFNPSPIPIATDRTYYGDGTNYLRVDPFAAASITAVDLPDDYTAPDYVIRGSYLVRTGETHVLPTVSWYPYLSGWPAGVAVTINAVWGWVATPADVKLAVIELVINLWRETDPANIELININSLVAQEGVSGRALPPRVAEVARRYRMSASPAFV